MWLLRKAIIMLRLVSAALAAGAAIVCAPIASANPTHDVLCFTNQAFAHGHSTDCAGAKNPLGDLPAFRE
ncbi:DUF7327 family protein [Mycolicibacterium mageritense]|uniref:DUF7327 family protein n=2 Tax=Mycolicibacterium mageritense TaxID=53462 RepID=UPI003AFFF01A